MPAKSDHWLQETGDSLKQEIDGDAPLVAQQLFGDKQPDAQSVPDDQMAQHISSAYQRGDRLFLHRLARSNPAAFLRVWKSLGGTVPPEPVDLTPP